VLSQSILLASEAAGAQRMVGIRLDPTAEVEDRSPIPALKADVLRYIRDDDAIAMSEHGTSPSPQAGLL
jgi:hypothetical protein